jgi:hypothetical protein
MQIKSLIIYSRHGEVREVPFKLGAVNIITGKSSTGKSAIIEIVEFCLGRSSFNVPEGVIRDTVSWYGVIYQIHDTQVLVAKPAPVGNKIFQSRVYFEEGVSVTAPPFDKLVPNSNDGAVIQALSRLVGISPNLNVPERGQSREPLEATIQHASFYLYQDQSVIASKHVLFHRQMEDFIPQAIKDTLPYFLGAVREDRLKLEQEAKNARRELKLAEREFAEAQYIGGDKARRGQSLLAEAQQVGLIPEDFVAADGQAVGAALKKVVKWRPRTAVPVVDDRLPKVRQELIQLRREFGENQERIEAGESFAREAKGYSTEASEQLMRLESIHLFGEQTGRSELCPLCSAVLSEPSPKMAVINRRLQRLKDNLDTAQRERPRLREHLHKLKEKREAIRAGIKERELAVEAILEEEKASKRLRDSNARVARVVGRVSLYLESVSFLGETSGLKAQLAKLKSRVSYYEHLLDTSEEEDMRASILNRIGLEMTDLARKLDLEHSEYPYRFDLRKLSVIADRPERPIPMDRIGGAENWLGCHLIAHLAIHKHFVKQKRPVPNLLILDQPSQVYFPSVERYRAMEGKASDLEASDADIRAVRRMFGVLFEVCKSVSPDLQIIILEHANLDQAEFQSALVEEPWTEGRALVPEGWLKE